MVYWGKLVFNLAFKFHKDTSTPEHSLSPVLRIYISSPRDTHTEVDILMKVM
jgi:hypothetical protein